MRHARTIVRMFERGYPVDKIARKVELPVEEVSKVIQAFTTETSA